MFWVIAMPLMLQGPHGKPMTAPVLVPPLIAFVVKDQCEAAVKKIMAETASKNIGCLQVPVIAKGAEMF